MLVGINAPSLINKAIASSPGLMRDRLCELDMRSVRLTLIWAHLDPAGEGRLRADVCEQIDQAILELPTTSKLLGVLLNPSHKVTEDYFHDPSTISERFALFARAMVKRFPSITEWEIWNEPNASDFYLSIKDGKNARPWSPEEFFEQILLPGARAIKQAQPHSRLCIAGVAEDGVIGHEDRASALSNRMPRTAEYESFRTSDPHGHFYFIPKFWDGLSTILAQHQDEVSHLFDACAFHPYPYFKIHQRENKQLLPSTIAHSEAFFEKYDAAGLTDLEIWATEFGGRSLEVAGQHRDNENQQADYAKSALDWMAATKRISRAYWYKLVDLPWDLQQEKTFGLLNYRMMARDAYQVVRKIAHEHHIHLPREEILETFQDAPQPSGSGFPSEAWEVSADTIFGYTLGSLSKAGTGECLVVPGRRAGNKVRVESKEKLDAPLGRAVSARVDVSFPFDSAPCDLVIELFDCDMNTLSLSLCIDASCSIRIEQGEQEQEVTLDKRSWPVAESSSITRIESLWDKNFLYVYLYFGDFCLHRSFEVEAPNANSPIKLAVSTVRKSSRPVFLSLSRIEARIRQMPTLPWQPPRNQQDEDNWFLSLPRYSQIFQDDWVMQMLRFKRSGFFAEIGGHDGLENSNTVLLERLLNWRGMIIEANPRWHQSICLNRSAIAYNNAAFSESGGKLQFVDAGAIGGLVDFLQDDIHAGKREAAIKDGHVIEVHGRRVDELLVSASAPSVVDYMSVDTEGSEAEVLSGIDFTKWGFALITVEHGGVEANRSSVWDILRPHGYLRHRVWFEDWFWHPSHLAVALDTNESDARAHASQVFARERYHRQKKLISEANEFRQANDLMTAANYYEEAGKSFHPDNVHGLVEAIGCRAQLHQNQRAINICKAALQMFPRNPRVLRRSALVFAENNRNLELSDVLNRMKKHAPSLFKEESIARIVDEL